MRKNNNDREDKVISFPVREKNKEFQSFDKSKDTIIYKQEEMLIALLGDALGINKVLDMMRSGKTVYDVYDKWLEYAKHKYK